MFVPLPSAVDDHQSSNARFLVDQGAGWLLPQSELTAQRLAQIVRETSRAQLLACAVKARALAKTGAVAELVAACEALAHA